MKTDPIGLYVHIPFCLKKCNYCDFCSYTDVEDDLRRRYIDALIEEIHSYKKTPKIKANTVFFGGGTPTLLTCRELSNILSSIRETFDVVPESEITMEMNPKTANQEKLADFYKLGVNRISIGMQSIHENELKKLGRIHNYNDFLLAFNTAKQAGFNNISVDIMYGIPEQTKESFKETIDTVLLLKPQHISVYGLILEENTPFWSLRSELPLPSEDDECDMYYYVADALGKAGYSHYEISNYSQPGYSSRHNLKYWHCGEYIGFGLSAYSYFNGERFGNAASFEEYFQNKETKYYREKISVSDREYEYAMLALRLKEGISLKKYSNAFGKKFTDGREEILRKYIDTGNIILTDEKLMLTEKGFYISNTILTDLL